MPDLPIRFQQIDHVGVAVWSVENAGEFYDHTSAKTVLDEVSEEYNVRAVFLDVDGVLIELLEPLGPGNIKQYLRQHGPGYQHVAYRVPDLADAIQSLAEAGYSFRTDEPLPGIGNSTIIFLEENHTSGLQIELVERS
jgi:methylmalonyl-CoA/ethylmalonyl-CoA epimerase